MSSIHDSRHIKIVDALKALRKRSDVTQDELCNCLGIRQSDLSKLETGQRRLELLMVADYAACLGSTVKEVLIESGLIPKQGAIEFSTNSQSIPVPNIELSEDTEYGLKLALIQGDQTYHVLLENCTKESVKVVDSALTELFIRAGNDSKFKNRDAISQALSFAIENLPKANPSDVYHHLVYRTYCREYNSSDPKQSWVRAGGEAVELFIKNSYGSVLKENGIEIRLAFEQGKKNVFLTDMGINQLIPGKSKLDIGLYGLFNEKWIPFGGIHSKASLAERVSDDKPCSEVMMKNGFSSYLFTFDAKSFPPPAGDLVNKGELGSSEVPTDKRDYIEEYGSFTCCFSYNCRTVASPARTKSGNKIFTITGVREDDLFVQTLIQDWNAFRATKLQN